MRTPLTSLAVSLLLATSCGGVRDGATSLPASEARTRQAATGNQDLAARGADPLPEPSPQSDPLRELAALSSDPAPEDITLDTHYVVSNEDQQHAFRNAIKGLGGAYVGVGAEQSYLFGGWARSDILYLLDFDDWVVHINEVYGLVFRHAQTPEQVIELWSADREAEVVSWIDASEVPPSVRAERKAVFTQSRARVEHRLKMLKQWLDGAKIPFFGNDRAELEHIATMWRTGRVRCVRGDLTMKGALQSFADWRSARGGSCGSSTCPTPSNTSDTTRGGFAPTCGLCPSTRARWYCIRTRSTRPAITISGKTRGPTSTGPIERRAS
ncbi:MAG: hypothetical protein HOW73_32855 [Polyangiaceae bacterium]|nr:hypothetical protein [Polyangiaceae bacterium]